MFCSRCGKTIESQAFCPHCGASTGVAAPAVGVAVPAAVALQTSRVPAHLRTLGILWVVYSAYLVLQWLLVLPFLHVFSDSGQAWINRSDMLIYAPLHPGGWLLHFIAVMVFARAALSLATGLVLLTRQPWGRTFAIVIAVLTLIKPLLGMLLAIYTLWVLLSRNAGPDYDRIALCREQTPL